MGLDTQTNRIVLSNSNYTLDKNSTGHLVDRLYVDTTFLTKSVFEINNALPGIPVTNGLAMAFIPTPKTCSVSSNGQIDDITDPLTQIALGAPVGLSQK